MNENEHPENYRGRLIGDDGAIYAFGDAAPLTVRS